MSHAGVNLGLYHNVVFDPTYCSTGSATVILEGSGENPEQQVNAILFLYVNHNS